MRILSHSLYPLFYLIICLFFPKIAICQVSGDGSLNTNVTSSDRLNFNINDGNRAGNNLFHSFQEFSVPSGGSAIFYNSQDISNIISRVTGGKVSDINGLIKAQGNANLFLINPQGIIFGENAKLDIGGSFIGSTAESINFADGSTFSAINPQNPPLLTISTPIGLQYGQNPGNIRVNGGGNNLRTEPGVAGVITDDRPVGLQVREGNTLALVGGNVILQGGNLSVEGGRIELGSVGSNSNVSLSVGEDSWNLGYENVDSFGDIKFSQAASADISGKKQGTIELQGSSITLEEGSALLGLTKGTNSSGNIIIQARDAVKLSGSNSTGLPSLVTTGVNPDGRANAGDITIQTSQLQLNDGAVISSLTLGNGNAGNISIDASESVELNGVNSLFGNGSAISTQVNQGATGNAGELSIKTGRLILNDGATIASTTRGHGNGGNLEIQASQLVELAGLNKNGLSSRISAQVNRGGFGNAGNLTIGTTRLILGDGAQIATGTFGQGNGNNLLINASEFVELSGVDGRGFGSGIVTQVSPTAIGDAGNLTIETKRLTLNDGGFISSATRGNGNGGDLTIRSADLVELKGFDTARGLGSSLATTVDSGAMGNAGNIKIETSRLLLENGAQILSATFANGDAGNLTIKATDSVELRGQNLFERGAVIVSGVGPRAIGNAGELSIDTRRLLLGDGAQIISQTFGQGNANDLMVQASNLVALENGSIISASTSGGGNAGNLSVITDKLRVGNGAKLFVSARGEFPAGSLTINANSILLNNQASLNAETAAGSQGNISLESQDVILRGNSEITTNATGNATGGNIKINTDVLFVGEDSSIVAQAEEGRGGNINITTQGLFQFPSSPIDASSLLGIDGTVEINTPDIDPSQQITELPQGVIDIDNLLATSCLVPSRKHRGKFIVNGSGGLASVPGGPMTSNFATYSLVSNNHANKPSNSVNVSSSVIESEGIFTLEHGGIVLARRCG